MIISMLTLFVIGYILIALEQKTKINKTAVALSLSVILWTLYIFSDPSSIIHASPEAFHDFMTAHPEYSHLSLREQTQNYVTDLKIIQHLGSVAEILFYLLGAMIIVEVVDSYHGFDFITKQITTKSKRKLLWIIALLTFFMSSVLDNMTSAIIMILLMQKLLSEKKERWLFGSIIIIAANSGGAWTPIGDVTTIMLWINNNISSTHIMKSIFLPSFISLVIPLFLTSFFLKGQSTLQIGKIPPPPYDKHIRNSMFTIGILCLLAVPVFKSITFLPPFTGIMLTLSIFWIYTDILNNKKTSGPLGYRITQIIAKTDFSTILFLLGILMAVAALESIGLLHILSQWLDAHLHNIYLINLIIGLLSSIIDNVPLVAATIGMYPLVTETTLLYSPEAQYLTNFIQDGHFWNLLAYCAGTGGSLLIIGSAAGVVVMGLEKINFIWYMKHISWRALIGFLAGIGIYYLQKIL